MYYRNWLLSMEPPRFLKTNGPVRCPSCGSEKVHLRDSPDRIDPLYQTPVRTVQRLFGAQLYHCFVCRMQFYDLPESAPAEAPSAADPVSATPADPAPPAAPLPPAVPHPVPAAGTRIGETVTIQGSVESTENISLYGAIDGSVTIPEHRLTIGMAGRIRGEVHASEVAASGTVHGNVDARSRVALGASANVIGNIRTPSLSVAEGAYLRGKVETRATPGHAGQPAKLAPTS
jgi:cytoskeletal protein CcmA (bactofilin family)